MTEGDKAQYDKVYIEKISGKTVQMSVRIDPAVIGGIRVEIDGKELDGTVQGRMEGISRRLEQAAL